MGRLWVVGLGPGGADALPPVNLEVLRRVRPLYLRTERHPLVKWLKEQGVTFTSFDSLYAGKATFAEVYQAIVETVVAETKARAEVVYAVPGHPLVAEKTVVSLLQYGQRREVELTILPAVSCLEAIFAVLSLDPAEGLVITEAGRLPEIDLRPDLGLLVLQVYDRMVASTVKLALAPLYGDEWPVWLLRAAGVPGEEKTRKLPLYAIDRQPWIDHLTSLYVPPATNGCYPGLPGSFATLVATMTKLRGPDGCPWDRAQTHASLRRYLLEETYEVLEALDAGDMPHLAEELGDLLLQIVFHAQIAAEAGCFNIHDVVAGINEKMYRRHPHIFGSGQAGTPDEVKAAWQKIKEQEKANGSKLSLLAGVPRALPALARAQKIQERAATVHFDWPDINGAWLKLREEEEELRRAVQSSRRQEIEHELGDLLFAAVNLARFLGVDAEEALRTSIKSFSGRFSYMEEACRLRNKALAELNMDELDSLWNEAKALESKNFPG